MEFAAGARPRLQSDCSEVPAGREEQGLAGCPVQLLFVNFNFISNSFNVPGSKQGWCSLPPVAGGARSMFSSPPNLVTTLQVSAKNISGFIAGNCYLGVV